MHNLREKRLPRPFVFEDGIELIQSADRSIYGKYGCKTDKYKNPEAYIEIGLANRKKPWKQYRLVQCLKNLRVFHGYNRTPCRIYADEYCQNYGKLSGCKKTPDRFHLPEDSIFGAALLQ